MTRPPTTNDMTQMEPSPEERSEGDFRFLHSSQLATRHHAKVCLDLLATLAREYPGETRFAIIKENIVDMESTGTDSQEYALARFVRPQLSAETIGELEEEDRQELNAMVQNRDDGTGDADDSRMENRFVSMNLDEMTPLAMATQDLTAACPFAAKEFNEVVQFAKKVVEAQFYGGTRIRYRNFQSSAVAILAYVIAHQTLKALPMTNGEREAVEQMIDKITNALESSDCQMHVFKSSKELADAAKECVKAELTMKGKIYNIKSSLHHVWHDEETKNKAQKKSATRNLHRYQSEIFIELGLTKKEKTQQ